MVKRSRAQRRADNDSLARVWGDRSGPDRLVNPLKQAQATVQTVRFQSDGTHFKSYFQPKKLTVKQWKEQQRLKGIHFCFDED